MKHISILLLENVNLAGMDNARQGLIEANRFLLNQGKSAAFKVELVGISSEVKINDGMYSAISDTTIDQLEKTDVIVIPPVQEDIGKSIEKNAAFFAWIAEQYKNGAEVLSLCLGAFILAQTGLLKGRECVTHWRASEQFRSLYPDTKLVPERILTDEDGLYTGGGAFSSANLILYFIEKHIGRDAAIYCSKIFQIDLGRDSQSSFIIFQVQKDHDDELVKKTQEFIEKHYAGRVSVSEICEKFATSRRTLERRFKKATGNSLTEYLQRVRMEAGKRKLESGAKTVSEVQFAVGYNDAGAFRDVFKRYVGMTPVDYRERFSKVLA